VAGGAAEVVGWHRDFRPGSAGVVLVVTGLVLVGHVAAVVTLEISGAPACWTGCGLAVAKSCGEIWVGLPIHLDLGGQCSSAVLREPLRGPGDQRFGAMLDVLGVLLKVGFNGRYPVRADEFLDLAVLGGDEDRGQMPSTVATTPPVGGL
jgi:hypothetical protein